MADLTKKQKDFVRIRSIISFPKLVLKSHDSLIQKELAIWLHFYLVKKSGANINKYLQIRYKNSNQTPFTLSIFATRWVDLSIEKYEDRIVAIFCCKNKILNGREDFACPVKNIEILKKIENQIKQIINLSIFDKSKELNIEKQREFYAKQLCHLHNKGFSEKKRQIYSSDNVSYA